MYQVTKDPDEIVDWWLCYADPTMSNRLGADRIGSIVSVTVDPPGEVAASSYGINTTTITDDNGSTQPAQSVIALWLTGGVAGVSYEVTIKFTTIGGRTYDDIILLRCLND